MITYALCDCIFFTGVILVDEMALQPKISFDPATYELAGFTNLAEYTPEAKKTTGGDHALVLLFQPIQGKWLQAIGCFLSQGAASGDILHKILMEAIT